MADVLRSVLFVDFDNVFFSLQSADKDAAKAFANDPRGWLDAIESENHDPAAIGRRRLFRDLCQDGKKGAIGPFEKQAGAYRNRDGQPSQYHKADTSCHFFTFFPSALDHGPYCIAKRITYQFYGDPR